MYSPYSNWPWPAFIAHRGGGALAPENTLAAMRIGAGAGFGMVEYDVRLSQDEIPFLLHDDTVDRTSNGTGLASEMDWKTLGQIDFGSWYGPQFSGEPAPTLQAVARYTQAQGIHSSIEIKPDAKRQARTGMMIAQAASQWWAHASLPPLLSSFSETALDAARTAAPKLPRLLLIEGPIPSDWHTRMVGLGCIGLGIDTHQADQSLIQEIRSQGASVAVWTVNEPARAQELLAWGCQALYTDALNHVRAPASGLDTGH